MELHAVNRERNAPNVPPTAVPATLVRVLLMISSSPERLGWSIVIDTQPDLQLVASCESIDAAAEWIERQTADVSIVDEALLTPAACLQLNQFARSRLCRFVLLTRHTFVEAEHPGMCAFASGHLLKGSPADELIAAIRQG